MKGIEGVEAILGDCAFDVSSCSVTEAEGEFCVFEDGCKVLSAVGHFAVARRTGDGLCCYQWCKTAP